jgi:hypothetical protein
MKANELRIGNLIEYLVYDTQETPQEEWVENYVDIQDLQWLNENPDDKHYRPMKLTEELHKKFNAKRDVDVYKLLIYTIPSTRTSFEHSIAFLDGYVIFREGNDTFGYDKVVTLYNPDITKRDIYVHEWQNLYFSLTGEELTL